MVAASGNSREGSVRASSGAPTQPDRDATVSYPAGPHEAVGCARGKSIGRFVVLEQLGRGGMGVVFAAYDPVLDRKVAVKLLRRSTVDTAGRQRMLREAQVMARVSHPNVIPVYEVGIVGGNVFVAMEYVRGTTLARWLETAPRPWRAVVQGFAQAGRGLAAGHDAGLLHRDFKPHNVLLGDDGRVRVIDFGLAIAADGSPEPGSTPSGAALLAPLTSANARDGTPAYMAPEQHLGLRLDARTDQFAFCAALYEGLYRQRAFLVDDHERLVDDVTHGRVRPPPADPTVPAALRDAVLRGLSSDPDHRFRSMTPLLGVLEHAQQRRARRWLWLAVGGAVLAASLGVAGSGGESRSRCDHMVRGLDGVWDPGVRAVVRAAFVSTKDPQAEETYRRVAAKLDAYGDAWATARVETCRATYDRAEQSERLFDLRMRCFDRLNHKLAALTKLLSAGGVERDHAVDAASSLDPLATCADTQALEAAFPPPGNPALATQVAALNEDLDGIEALQRAGRVREALPAAERATARAHDLDYPPIKVRAQLLVASIHRDDWSWTAAETAYRDAINAAAAAHDDRNLARADGGLLLAVSNQWRFREAETLAVLAVAATVRAGDPPEIRGRLEYYIGNLRLGQANYPEARGHYERALALLVRVHGENHPLVANVLNNLATVAMKLGDLGPAGRYLDRAIAVDEAAVGPNHPRLAVLLHNRAEIAIELGDYPRAAGLQQRALSLVRDTYGPDHHLIGTILVDVSWRLRLENHPEEAVEAAARAVALMSKGESTGAECAPAHFEYAKALWATGDQTRARVEATSARDIYADAGEGYADDRRRVEAWLAHPGK